MPKIIVLHGFRGPENQACTRNDCPNVNQALCPTEFRILTTVRPFLHFRPSQHPAKAAHASTENSLESPHQLNCYHSTTALIDRQKKTETVHAASHCAVIGRSIFQPPSASHHVTKSTLRLLVSRSVIST